MEERQQKKLNEHHNHNHNSCYGEFLNHYFKRTYTEIHCILLHLHWEYFGIYPQCKSKDISGEQDYVKKPLQAQ
jgi:hypothetical protein